MFVSTVKVMERARKLSSWHMSFDLRKGLLHEEDVAVQNPHHFEELKRLCEKASIKYHLEEHNTTVVRLGTVRGKNGIGEGWTICCNFSIVLRWIDQLFNQNPTVCCNCPSFPPGEREKVGHAGSEEGRKENCSKRWDFD